MLLPRNPCSCEQLSFGKPVPDWPHWDRSPRDKWDWTPKSIQLLQRRSHNSKSQWCHSVANHWGWAVTLASVSRPTWSWRIRHIINSEGSAPFFFQPSLDASSLSSLFPLSNSENKPFWQQNLSPKFSHPRSDWEEGRVPAKRNAMWVMKMSLISPCATLGPWAAGRRGRGKGPNLQLQGMGGVIKFRMHALPNFFFCLSDGLGLFLL